MLLFQIKSKLFLLKKEANVYNAYQGGERFGEGRVKEMITIIDLGDCYS